MLYGKLITSLPFLYDYRPGLFYRKDRFKKEMDRYIKSIKESTKAQNVTEILMPGEPEYRTESERLKQGIPLDSTTLQELVSLGKSLRISLSPTD